jgi:UDP-2,4-diacetamido-2,4,6-trideoxy-beta-L-altropyranose hydrolase
MDFIERVVIRVDASVEMGMGHLTRCMSLANELARQGAEVFFLMRSHAVALAGLPEAGGHTVRLLRDPEPGSGEAGVTAAGHRLWLPTTWQRDAEQTREAIDGIGNVDWLIVDHYALDAQWENAQRRQELRILAIDDLADRPHDCDILLDQNLVSAMETRYRNHVAVTTRQLLGPSYALLRPEFTEARKSLAARNGEVRRILICYGGSDPSNETAKALAAIKNLSAGPIAVDVAVGLSNPHADLIARLCLEMPRARMHRGADNMAELMSHAHLAIGAGGVMSWERCCLGLPTIAVDIAENQVGALTALAKVGALLHMGSAMSITPDQIAASIRSLLDDPAKTRTMGDVACALVDGEGIRRVSAEMVRRQRHGSLAP